MMTMVTDYSHGATMSRIVSASEFKAKCLALLDQVQRTGETLVITKKGKPVAEVTPHKPGRRNPIGIWKGRTEILGDIVSPIDVEWEALN
jgi:prevent-host-death family protein